MQWSAGKSATVTFFARAAYAGSPAQARSIVRPVAEAMRRMLRALLSAALARGELGA